MIQREFPSYSEDSPPPSEGYVFKYQSDSDDEEDLEPGIPYDAIIQSNQSENYYETVNRYFDHVTRNRIWEDSDYMTWLNIQTPPIIPSINNPEQDIIAMVIGIFMAKGETLDTGLTAEEFDLQLKECTGSRNNTDAYCIRMNELLSYMKPTEEEFQKCMKDKANILLHPMFSSILEYSTGTDRFKFKIPDILQNIYDSIKASGTTGHRRRDKAEKVKFDRMEDPINRQKYMITNNFLVLLISEIFDRTNDYEAPWQKIQSLFREMMEEEENHNDPKIRNIYIKYNASLGLKKLKSTNGCELNAVACRELLGRGTPSKAISHPIYRKIAWRNDPKKGLCLRLDGDLKQIYSFTYSERDFIDIQKEIDAANGMKKERLKEYKINNTKSRKELQRMQEEAEQEERKKYYVPTGINDANVFIPNNQESTFFGGNQVRQENQSQNMNQDNDYDEPCYNEENDYMYDDHYAMRDGRTENVFGQMDYIEDDDISSASEEVIDHGPNFTDEEETYQKPEPKKKEKKESTRIIETEGYVKACRNRSVENIPRQPPRPSNFPPKQSKLTVNQLKLTPTNPYAEVNIRESYRSPAREERTTIPSSSIYNTLMANSRSMSTRSNGAILASSTSSLASRLRIQSTGGPVNPSIFNAGQTETLDKEEFLNYLKLHVYFHRTIEGSPKRYWSSIQKYLSYPFTSPELIFGNDWLDSLHVMNIIVVPTKNDILFEWNDEVL